MGAIGAAFGLSDEKLGLELEMAVADREGKSHPVSRFFSSLQSLKHRRGDDAVLKSQAGRDIAVVTPLVNSSLDNAFNNLESAIGPVAGGPGGLLRLQQLVTQE